MLDQYSRAAPRWQLDFGITFCVPHRRRGLQCSANVGGSSLCTSGYVTLLCRLSAQLGHGDRCRESRESAEDWRWVMAAAGGEVATRPVVKIHCERHSIERGLTPIDKDPIKEVSGRSHPPGLQAGAKPALPPAAAHGSDSILKSLSIRGLSVSKRALRSLGSLCRAPPDERGSDLIAGPAWHLLSNDGVRFARNCD